MSNLKIALIVLGVFLGIIILAVFSAINISREYSTLIKVDNPEQCDLIIQGIQDREHHIVFKSLKETSLNDGYRILTVKYHFVFSDFGKNTDIVPEWLDSIGVKNYPEFDLR